MNVDGTSATEIRNLHCQ